jgi:two-component system, NtrC family, nitrogen regulation response regulator GlnG
MPLFTWLKRHDVRRQAEELLAECCQRLTLPEKRLGKSGREWIERRRWSADPGEMRRLIYAAALCAPGETVEAVHFPPRTRADQEATAGARFEDLSLEEVVRQKVAHFFERLGNTEAEGVHRAVMAQVERPLIERCLAWAQGNQLKAARVLGIHRNTLRKRMKELGVRS